MNALCFGKIGRCIWKRSQNWCPSISCSFPVMINTASARMHGLYLMIMHVCSNVPHCCSWLYLYSEDLFHVYQVLDQERKLTECCICIIVMLAIVVLLN